MKTPGVAVARPAPAAARAAANRPHDDAVGDQHRVAAEVLDEGLAGGLAARRCARRSSPAPSAPGSGTPPAARATAVIAVWKVATIGPRGRPARRAGQARRRRLVHVQHVEVALAQPPPHPAARTPGRTRPGRPSRCRAPAPRGRPARRTAAGACRRRPAASTETSCPSALQRLGEVADVRTARRPGRPRSTGRRARPSLAPPTFAGCRRSSRPARAAAACASRPGARRSRRRTRRRRLGHRGRDPRVRFGPPTARRSAGGTARGRAPSS